MEQAKENNQVGFSNEMSEKLFAGVSLRDPNDAIGFWLWRTFTAYQRRAERALEPLGVTHLQFVVLVTVAWLGGRQDEVSQRDVMKQTAISEAQLSFLVKALGKKRFLVQIPGKRDSRVRAISLTEAGYEKLRLALPIMTDLLKGLWPNQDAEVRLRALLRVSLASWDELD